MKIDFQGITLIVVEKNCRIIRMNSAILTNLFYTKGVNIKTAADASRTIGYYFFDNFTVEDILDLTQKLKELVYSKDLQNNKVSI